MDCHQILTGACNSGCNAVGSVEGVPFTVSKKFEEKNYSYQFLSISH